MNGTLINHRGAQEVTLDQLSTIEAPPPTATWFPVSHIDVYEAVNHTLTSAGYEIRRQVFSLAKDDHRFFGVLDLTSTITEGISLSVGIRNSTDKSFPIGMAVGSRVFVCDNLSFHGEIVIAKKHTRFGETRYREGIAAAVGRLDSYRQTQADWIGGLQQRPLAPEQADSLILRAYETELISTRLLPDVIKEWRQPEHEAFQPRNAWSLWNAFTSALRTKQESQPAAAALMTIRLQRLFTHEVSNGSVSATAL
jgi:hypothetical protein